uniref:Uncharacterized protein n=1 Tax=Cacopsylla melanoneura TaxID=428564 RepID=A0A8D8R2F3_9HEMI
MPPACSRVFFLPSPPPISGTVTPASSSFLTFSRICVLASFVLPFLGLVSPFPTPASSISFSMSIFSVLDFFPFINSLLGPVFGSTFSTSALALAVGSSLSISTPAFTAMGFLRFGKSTMKSFVLNGLEHLRSLNLRVGVSMVFN